MKILFVLDYNTFKNDLFDTAKKASVHADLIWFRIKDENADKIYNLSFGLKKNFSDVKFILSDRADIAEAAGFYGVHLNSRSIPPEKIKNKFPNLNVSYSAHNLTEINNLHCDFFTLSPIFETPKPYKITPIGVINVEPVNKKIYALGGINLSNLSDIRKCGFYGIAGIRFINELDLIKQILD
jgi:thiamine-phosphate pyrophosphorylase